MENKEYIKLANDLLKMSYSPYSKFAVAAVVIDQDGNIHKGVNVENAAYPLGICAERNAISAGVTNGLKKIKKIYITANLDKPISPCGACRQVISEFSDENTKVFLGSSKNDEIMEYSVEEIIPYHFGPSDL